MKGITSIGHVAIRVKEFERSLAFYVGKLGFSEMFRLDRDGSLWIIYLRDGRSVSHCDRTFFFIHKPSLTALTALNIQIALPGGSPKSTRGLARSASA